jgi:hypothetical protein
MSNMPILLCANEAILVNQLSLHDGDGAIVLIHHDSPALLHQVTHTLEAEGRSQALLAADVRSSRLHRINYDLTDYVIIDLPRELLLGSAGRRLVESLNHLALEELTLAFVGSEIELAGSFVADTRTAALNLIRHTLVSRNLTSKPNLRSLLLEASGQRLRLLAMDGSVSVTYLTAADSVHVAGDGSVLLVSFPEAQANQQPAARLHVLTDGMRSKWPS